MQMKLGLVLAVLLGVAILAHGAAYQVVGGNEVTLSFAVDPMGVVDIAVPTLFADVVSARFVVAGDYSYVSADAISVNNAEPTTHPFSPLFPPLYNSDSNLALKVYSYKSNSLVLAPTSESESLEVTLKLTATTHTLIAGSGSNKIYVYSKARALAASSKDETAEDVLQDWTRHEITPLRESLRLLELTRPLIVVGDDTDSTAAGQFNTPVRVELDLATGYVFNENLVLNFAYGTNLKVVSYANSEGANTNGVITHSDNEVVLTLTNPVTGVDGVDIVLTLGVSGDAEALEETEMCSSTSTELSATFSVGSAQVAVDSQTPRICRGAITAITKTAPTAGNVVTIGETFTVEYHLSVSGGVSSGPLSLTVAHSPALTLPTQALVSGITDPIDLVAGENNNFTLTIDDFSEDIVDLTVSVEYVLVSDDPIYPGDEIVFEAYLSYPNETASVVESSHTLVVADLGFAASISATPAGVDGLYAPNAELTLTATITLNGHKNLKDLNVSFDLPSDLFALPEDPLTYSPASCVLNSYCSSIGQPSDASFEDGVLTLHFGTLEPADIPEGATFIRAAVKVKLGNNPEVASNLESYVLPVSMMQNINTQTKLVKIGLQTPKVDITLLPFSLSEYAITGGSSISPACTLCDALGCASPNTTCYAPFTNVFELADLVSGGSVLNLHNPDEFLRVAVILNNTGTGPAYSVSIGLDSPNIPYENVQLKNFYAFYSDNTMAEFDEADAVLVNPDDSGVSLTVTGPFSSAIIFFDIATAPAPAKDYTLQAYVSQYFAGGQLHDSSFNLAPHRIDTNHLASFALSTSPYLLETPAAITTLAETDGAYDKYSPDYSDVAIGERIIKTYTVTLSAGESALSLKFEGNAAANSAVTILSVQLGDFGSNLAGFSPLVPDTSAKPLDLPYTWQFPAFTNPDTTEGQSSFTFTVTYIFNGHDVTTSGTKLEITTLLLNNNNIVAAASETFEAVLSNLVASIVPPAPAIPGNQQQYIIRYVNDGDAPFYGILSQMAIPTEIVTTGALTVTTSAAHCIPSYTVTPGKGTAAGASEIEVTIPHLIAGCTVDIEIPAQLYADSYPGQEFTLSLDYFYTTSNGVAGQYGNILSSSTSELVVVDKHDIISFAIAGSEYPSTSGVQVALGEYVDYMLNVSLARGDSKAVKIVINLPATETYDIARFSTFDTYLTYALPAALESSSTDGVVSVTSSQAGDNGKDVLTINLGDIIVSKNLSLSNLFTIRFRAFLLDVPDVVEDFRFNVTASIESTQPGQPTQVDLEYNDFLRVTLPTFDYYFSSVSSGQAGDYRIMQTEVWADTEVSQGPLFGFYASIVKSPKVVFSEQGKISYPANPSGSSVVQPNVTSMVFYVPQILNSYYTLEQKIRFLDTVRPFETVNETFVFEYSTRLGPIMDYDNNDFYGRKYTVTDVVSHDVYGAGFSYDYSSSLSSNDDDEVAPGEKAYVDVDYYPIRGTGKYTLVYTIANDSFLAFDPSATTLVAKSSDLSSVVTFPAGSTFNISGNVATFDLGEIVNPGTLTGSNYIYFRATLVVVDPSEFSSGDTAEVSIEHIVDGVSKDTTTVTYTLVKPKLLIERTSASEEDPLVAGESALVTYRIRHHTTESYSSAYHVTFQSDLPATLKASSPATNGACSLIITQSTSGNHTVTIEELPTDCTVEVSFRAELTKDVLPNTTYTFAGSLEYYTNLAEVEADRGEKFTADAPEDSLSTGNPSVSLAVTGSNVTGTRIYNSGRFFDALPGELLEVTATVQLMPGTQYISVAIYGINGTFEPLGGYISASGAEGAVVGTNGTKVGDAIVFTITEPFVFDPSLLVRAAVPGHVDFTALFVVLDDIPGTELAFETELDYQTGTDSDSVEGYIMEAGLTASHECEPQEADWDEMEATHTIVCTTKIEHNYLSNAWRYNVRFLYSLPAHLKLAGPAGYTTPNWVPAPLPVFVSGTGDSDRSVDITLNTLPLVSENTWIITYTLEVASNVVPTGKYSLGRPVVTYDNTAADPPTNLKTAAVFSERYEFSVVTPDLEVTIRDTLPETENPAPTPQSPYAFVAAVGETVEVDLTAVLIHGTNPISFDIQHDFAADGSSGLVRVEVVPTSIPEDLTGLLVSEDVPISGTNRFNNNIIDAAEFSLGNVVNPLEYTNSTGNIVLLLKITPVDSAMNVNNRPFTVTVTMTYGTSAKIVKKLEGTIVVPQLTTIYSCPTEPSQDVQYLDKFTCNVTVTHAAGNNVPAFNVTVTDLFPVDELELVAETVSITSDNGGVVESGNGAGNSSVLAYVPVLAAGETFTVIYDVQIAQVIVPRKEVSTPESAFVTYYSSPSEVIGDTRVTNVDVMLSNPSTFYGAVPVIATTVTSHSLAENDVSDDHLYTSIGEETVFSVTIELIAGTNPLTITVSQSGIAQVALSGSIAAIDSDVTSTAEDFQVGAEAQVVGTSIVFNLGNVTAATTGKSLSLTFTILPTDVQSNEQGTGFALQVIGDYGAGATRYTKSFEGTLVEPVLSATIACEADDGEFTVLNKDDEYTCELVIAHTDDSDASAYDIKISDFIDGQFVASDVVVSLAGAVVGTDDTLNVTIPMLKVTESVTVSWTATADFLRTLAPHSIPSATLTVNYKTADENARTKKLDPQNTGDLDLSLIVPPPTWTFEVSPYTRLVNPESEANTLTASIGETFYVTAVITPILGYTPLNLKVSHNYGTGNNGTLDLSLDSVSVSAGINAYQKTETESQTYNTGITDSITYVVVDENESPYGIIATAANTQINLTFAVYVPNLNANVAHRTFEIVAAFNFGQTQTKSVSGEFVEQNVKVDYSCTFPKPTLVFEEGDIIECSGVVYHDDDSAQAATDLMIVENFASPYVELLPGSISAPGAFIQDDKPNVVQINRATLELEDTQEFKFSYRITRAITPGAAVRFDTPVVTYSGSVRSYTSALRPLTDVSGTGERPSFTAALETGTPPFRSAIGDTVTVRVTITPMWGTQLLNLAVSQDTGAAGVHGVISFAGDAPSVQAGITGVSSAVPTVNNNVLTYALGDKIENNGATTNTHPTITLLVRLTAPNLAANLNQARLNSLFTLTTNTAPTSTASINGLVIEPALTIQRNVELDALEAGATYQVSYTISHASASTSAAHALTLTDTFADSSDLILGTATVSPAAAGSVTKNGNTFTVNVGQIAIGATVTFEYTFTVANTITPRKTITLTGITGSYRSSSVASGYKTYDLSVGSVTATAAANSVEITIDSTSIDDTPYTANSASLTIDETLDALIRLKLMRGTHTFNLVTLLESLSAQPRLVSVVVDSISQPSWINGITVGQVVPLAAGNTSATFSLNNVVNAPANPAATGEQIITLRAVVIVPDVPANTVGKSFSLSANAGQVSAAIPAIDIVEPQLDVTVEATVTSTEKNQAGFVVSQEMHYVITFDHTAASRIAAHNLLAEINIDASLLEVDVASITVNGATLDSSTESLLNFSLATLALDGDVTIEFDASYTLQRLYASETTLEIALTYTSSAAAPFRSYAVNKEFAVPLDAPELLHSSDLVTSLDATPDLDIAVGETATLYVVVSLPLDATTASNLSISVILPPAAGITTTDVSTQVGNALVASNPNPNPTLINVGGGDSSFRVNFGNVARTAAASTHTPAGRILLRVTLRFDSAFVPNPIVNPYDPIEVSINYGGQIAVDSFNFRIVDSVIVASASPVLTAGPADGVLPYTITLAHAPTSTGPAARATITVTIPDGLQVADFDYFASADGFEVQLDGSVVSVIQDGVWALDDYVELNFNLSTPSVLAPGATYTTSVASAYSSALVTSGARRHTRTQLFNVLALPRPTIVVTPGSVAAIPATGFSTDDSITYSFTISIPPGTSIPAAQIVAELGDANLNIDVASLDVAVPPAGITVGNVVPDVNATHIVIQVADVAIDGSLTPEEATIVLSFSATVSNKALNRGSGTSGELLLPKISIGTSEALFDPVPFGLKSPGTGVSINLLGSLAGNVSVTTDAANGLAPVTANRIAYTPNVGFLGTDRLVARVCVAGLSCFDADLAIEVTDVVSNIVAVNDAASTYVAAENGIVAFPLDNDEGNFDPATLAIVTPPAASSGTAVLKTVDGKPAIVLTNPTPASGGNATVVYRICDSYSNCAEATITYTWTAIPVAQPPRPVSAASSTSLSFLLALAVLAVSLLAF